VPESEEENGAVGSLTGEMGFDPCLEAHRLRDKRGESRDPKRVLRGLVGDVVDDAELLDRVSLAKLRERGRSRGSLVS